MPQPSKRRARSRSQSRSSSTSVASASHSRTRKREASQTIPDPPAPVPEPQMPMIIPQMPMMKLPQRMFRISRKNSIQRDYLEYKLRTESYKEKKEPAEEEKETKEDSSSDEDFTERIKRFEKKQLEQKKQQTTQPASASAASSKSVFQFTNLTPTTPKPDVDAASNDSPSGMSAWQSTSDTNQTVPMSEVFKAKTNPLQSIPTFVSSFIPLHKQVSENSNSGSNEPIQISEPSISTTPNTQLSTASSTPSSTITVQPSTSTLPPEVKQTDEPQTKKICFAFSRIKPALAYDPLEKSKDKDDKYKEEDSVSEESSSDDDIEESSVDDHIKISKTKPKIRFSLAQKIRDNPDDQEMLNKLYQRWYKFSWKNYDTGMIPVHLGRVPDEAAYTDFEKLQIRDELRSIPPQIDLMRDYFLLMHELADYYCSFPENFVPVQVEGGSCLRMKASVKRSIPFVGFMRMLNNNSYTYEQLDDWLTKLDWRLLETNRFLESPVREPIHKMPQPAEPIIHQTNVTNEPLTNGNISDHTNGDIIDKEPEMDADFEDELEVSPVSEFVPETEPDSMDGVMSVDNVDNTNEAPVPSSKSSDEDDVAAPFVPLYEGLVEPKIYHIDDRLPPIPVLCSRDPKSSNPVSEEQFFLDKLYNQEYYYSTKEFRIDVVPPPARPIMFLLESLKERHLPNGKLVPVGQQVLFVMPRYNEDL